MRRWLVILIILVVAVAGWAFNHFVWTGLTAIAALEQKPVYDDLNDRQQKVIDILIERNKLIASLCTLIIGGTVGILVTVAKEIPASVPASCWVTLGASWLALGASIYGGYKHYEGIALMLAYKFFEPFESYFVRWSEVQFWLFLVGLAFSIFFLLEVAFLLRRK